MFSASNEKAIVDSGLRCILLVNTETPTPVGSPCSDKYFSRYLGSLILGRRELYLYQQLLEMFRSGMIHSKYSRVLLK